MELAGSPQSTLQAALPDLKLYQAADRECAELSSCSLADDDNTVSAIAYCKDRLSSILQYRTHKFL